MTSTFDPSTFAGNTTHNAMPHGNVSAPFFNSHFVHWSFILVEVTATVIIVIGDITMLILFFTRKLLGQSTNILVFSVVIGDLLTGIITFPLVVTNKVLPEPSEFLCKSYSYLANICKTAVGFSILLLSLERVTAVLSHTFRILPPGRCLFFASLTWFFSAAFNIWSVVIYNMEVVPLSPTNSMSSAVSFSVCFASGKFMYLHAIFKIINPIVTFLIPVLFSSALFIAFWFKMDNVDQPGRPYKSSKSVIIFTFALLICFVISHLPWEVANIVFVHDARVHNSMHLLVFKMLHKFSFSRGLWDIIVFGAFRSYVCKKERALAMYREQRTTEYQNSGLTIPVSNRQMSTSLLDSDPSVSRRYSSDVTISKRPSCTDELLECVNFREGGKCYQNRDGGGKEASSPLLLLPCDRATAMTSSTLVPRDRAPSLTSSTLILRDRAPSLTSSSLVPRDRASSLTSSTLVPRDRAPSLTSSSLVTRDRAQPLTASLLVHRDRAQSLTSSSLLPRDRAVSLTPSTFVPRDRALSLTSSTLVPRDRALSLTSSTLLPRDRAPSLTVPTLKPSVNKGHTQSCILEEEDTTTQSTNLAAPSGNQYYRHEAGERE